MYSMTTLIRKTLFKMLARFFPLSYLIMLKNNKNANNSVEGLVDCSLDGAWFFAALETWRKLLQCLTLCM